MRKFCVPLGGVASTVPFKVIQQVLKLPLTAVGLKNFLADWDELQAMQKTQQPAMA